ncbi:C-type lectin domain family 12 member B isoform X1 [Oreochromis niloticus]|uniref:C-type lectin domain family 12 member B isoform X1 n=1 Tax=Oreochromis niloticus TaxID=8128 RepID=UPI0009055D7C|nr:C-type lectin domain family 12 member B isoform X1 [Oreochromis niloticus]
MSSDIYAKPDLSKKVRYSRKEDGAEWEQREVDIYESADAGGGPQTQSPPSVQKGSFRCATLALRVLCLLMLAGIIILSICYALNKNENNKFQIKHEEVQTKYDKLNHVYNDTKKNHTELQDELQDTKTNLTQLQSSYDKLSKNHSQLQEEVKKLKEKIEEKCPDRWRRFGSSCYFKSTERKTWSESRRDCQDKGADLVMINSKEEQEFIRKLGGESWIGLYFKWTSGGYKWEWVDGSALTQTFWAEGYGNPSSGYYGVCCDDYGRWRQSLQYNNHNYVYGTFICEK